MIRIRDAENVFERSLMRIRWLYDEFGQIVVSFSGGKDSTVTLELALIVARERGIEKVPVVWLDQEAEYTATVEYCSQVFTRPDIDPYWLQIPLPMSNNASHGEDEWMTIWDPEMESLWIHPKSDIAITEDRWNVSGFASGLHEVIDSEFPGCAALNGLRIEESPARMLGLTGNPKHKWITWGKKNKHHVAFSPIYDWSWTDIWKAIHDNGWTYNRHYDEQFRHGIPIRDMRVSSFIHQTAARNLFSLQEIDREAYERAVQRTEGLATTAQMGAKDYLPKELPHMFVSWEEYRDHLVATLFDGRLDRQKTFHDFFASQRKSYPRVFDDPKWGKSLVKSEARAVITNDIGFTQLKNAMLSAPRTLKLSEKRVAELEKQGRLRTVPK